jgi:chromosome segregation ATPase
VSTEATSSTAATKKPEYNPEYDLEKLQQEKEQEINALLSKLEGFKSKIDRCKAETERNNTK